MATTTAAKTNSNRRPLVIPIVAVLAIILAIAVFKDEIAGLFQRDPTPSVILGSWELDKEALDEFITTSFGQQPAEVNPMLAQYAKQYRDGGRAMEKLTLIFNEGWYSTSSAGKAGAEIPCTYEGFRPRTIVIRPTATGKDPQVLTLDEKDADRLQIHVQDLTFPLRRIEQ